jgi:hypothetical protein
MLEGAVYCFSKELSSAGSGRGNGGWIMLSYMAGLLSAVHSLGLFTILFEFN